jgi:tetratricopeptide (TPR) repeat protein
MLRAQKKISKRVIKEDKLVSTYFEAQTWIDENRKMISTIGFILVVAVLAGWFYYNNVQENNRRAMTELGEVFSYYDNGQYQIAVNGIPARNIEGLQSIVDNYGHTVAGNLAKLYLADSYYNTGDYDKALQYFEDFSGSTSLLKVSALAGEAACYEAKKDFKTAAERYEKAALSNTDDPDAAENLANAARDYGRAGDKDHALEILQKIKKEYPNSPTAREVELYIAEVNA